MTRHNNMIPDGHFHKNWHEHVKTWFNQPMRKFRRHNLRLKKLKTSIPCPVDKFRPTVHCPTVRYNNKLKTGRGFSLKELKSANLNPKFARTIGIAVDPRRRNKSHETLSRNAQLLKKYMADVIVFPKKKWPEKFNSLNAKVTMKNLKVKQPTVKLTSRVPTEEEKNFKAFETLRKARADEKHFGRRQKLKKLKEAGVEIPQCGKKRKMKRKEATE